MKLAADNKRAMRILAVVLVILAGVVVWDVWSAGGPLLPSHTESTPAGEARGLRQLDPRLRLDKIDRLRAIHYTATSGRDLFHIVEAAPPPPPPQPGRGLRGPGLPGAQNGVPAAPVVVTPPPPPPIPIKYYGYVNGSDGKSHIFLQLGDEIYIANQGDVISQRYEIVSVEKLTIKVRDRVTSSEQTIPLQQAPTQP